jgi:branched-subunit amino acid aminotransferase/4-amino-4-deoxychorismate lyase
MPFRTLRETVRVVAGRVPLWRFHRERLTEGGIPPRDFELIEPAVLAAVEAAGPGVVKLHVIAAPGRFEVHSSAEPSSLSVPGGPRIAPVTVSSLPTLPAHAAKSADRRYWDGPMRLAHLRGADQAVLVTEDGLVVDGGSATVWAVAEGVLLTPSTPPAVAGVARRFILREVAPSAGVPSEVRAVSWEELEHAEELLLSNAVGGLVAVRGRGGRVAELLGEAWMTAMR